MFANWRIDKATDQTKPTPAFPSPDRIRIQKFAQEGRKSKIDPNPTPSRK